jgi:hypothetical protein
MAAQTRSERNARTTSRPAVARCARYAVRGLIVAGFAGAAWLLSASVAHASSGQDGPDAEPGTGLLSSVTSLFTGDGGASTERSGATRHRPGPDRTTADRGRDDLLTGTVLTVLSPVTSTAAPVTGAVTATVTGAVPGTVTNTVHRTVTLTQAPVQTMDRAASSATADASSAMHASTKRPAKAGIIRTRPTRTQEPAVQAVPVRSGPLGDIAAAATGNSVAGVDPAVAKARAADRLRAFRAEALLGAHAKPVADRTVAQGTRHVPLLPRPAPVPAPPAAGLASGAPSTGSGLNHDGGAAAAPPAAPAGTKVLTFRPDAVEDVELRLLAAEKPTVSPD